MKLKLMEMPMISKERFLELQNEGETSQNLLKEEIKPVEEEEPKTPLKGSAKVDFITTDNLKVCSE